MKQRIRYALVGCGRIAPNHLAAALACPEVEVVALCDLLPERMEACAQRAGLKVPKIPSFQDLLKQYELDLVAIATDSGSHLELAQQAVEAGVSVLVEKPLGLSLEGIDLLLERAKEKGVLVGTCHQNRFNPAVQFLHQSVQSGQMGKLYSVNAQVLWNRGKDYYAQAPWRGTWQGDGGTLMNQCIHNLDLLLWTMGECPTEVFAYTDQLFHPYLEAEDFGLAIFRFPSGGYGLLQGTTNVFPKNLEETLTVLGERGTVRLGGTSVNRLERCLLEGQLEEEAVLCQQYSNEPPNVYGYGHTPLYRNMVGALLGRTPLLVDGWEGCKAVEAVLAVYRSAAEGRPIQFPLQNTSTLDFVGRFSAL